MTEWDKRREQIAAAYAPELITVAEYQRWEVLRYLAVTDPQFIKEMEAAA